ncbi:hypothetical protein SAMN04515648_2880 [Phyllobacterium sp. CL33Tsu]|uniref:DUF6339 family protein n=1 Tax=Phyllobacterium sp. CL33Tsu TaxID=1798191 RepID=UPI0008E1605B|nr:DUF6339 family protein [Phyllobacterium sp. CL33Tsu]SFJ14840.1 hypothetical protein SAMN04515648_2880 [Phyllobacterium sp. CL33Tsu]
MPYPILGKKEARLYLQVCEDVAGEEMPALPDVRQSDGGGEENWDAIAAEIVATLDKLIVQSSVQGEVKGSAFEAAAGPMIHTLLPEHPALADPEFWIWLALVHCLSIIDRRYPGKRNLKNFGIGGAGENLLYRLWLRAEIAHQPTAKDAYELARFGDIDFWRSHIFRQGYGEVRHFARALVEFQFPSDRGRRSRLTIEEIRSLAKQLKRARTNLMFEVMSESRAAHFIETEWERLALEIR